MIASDRTPVGSPPADPSRDSDSVLPRTYGRTHGDGLVTLREMGCVSNAREPKKLIALDPDDLHFIVTYDPDRERSASRRDMVAVLEEIQALVNEGVTAVCSGCRADDIAAEETA